MAEAGDDPRRERILEAAFRMFVTYGFSRTTMDDIARAAELSRPALYLVFRNKADIYRALATDVLDEVVTRARAALAGEGTLLERLDAMIESALFEIFREIDEAPHGPELFDIRGSLAEDIMIRWRTEMIALLEGEIEAETARLGVDIASQGFSARTVACTFLDSLEGMKARISGPQCHREEARACARVLVAALRP